MKVHESDVLEVGTLKMGLEQLLQSVIDLSSRRDELAQKGMLGGYYCRASSDGMPQAVLRIGEPPLDKAVGRVEKAVEKVQRLAVHMNHETSRQSADESKGMYAGAVRGRSDLHSFSGLPADLDEIYSCLVALWLGDMDEDAADRILGEENDYYKVILKHLP